MRKLSIEKRTAILSSLVEGNSINATARMCGVSKITVLRLLADAGQFCADYHDVYVRGLASKRVQADEIWAFCGCKDKAKKAGAGGYGSVWTWVAIDADLVKREARSNAVIARRNASAVAKKTKPVNRTRTISARATLNAKI